MEKPKHDPLRTIYTSSYRLNRLEARATLGRDKAKKNRLRPRARRREGLTEGRIGVVGRYGPTRSNLDQCRATGERPASRRRTPLACGFFVWENSMKTNKNKS